MSTAAVREMSAAEQLPRTAHRGFDRPRFLWVLYGLVAAYLFIPIIVVIVFSFNASRSLSSFDGLSLRWYRTFFNDATVTQPLYASLKIAAITMVVATILGTLLAMGLTRARGREIGAANILMLAPLITPEIVTGVGLLLLFSHFNITLSLTTVTLGHITFSISFVTVIVRARLANFNPEVEEAAMDLGATPLNAIRLVTIPALLPAILASALLVFLLSFDDFVTSFFTSGSGTAPLPVRIYSLVRYSITPEINAVGTTMIAISLALCLLAVPFMLRRERTDSATPPTASE
jgi:spermidine/putrescine transport system permease protein/putrescine transport system permease protein